VKYNIFYIFVAIFYSLNSNALYEKLISVFLFLPFFGHAQILTTVAGTGIPGMTGNGAAASVAEINYATDVVADSHGNLFFF